MRIAVTSQNFRTITGHAGRARRFPVFVGETAGRVPGAVRQDRAQGRRLPGGWFRGRHGRHGVAGEIPPPTAGERFVISLMEAPMAPANGAMEAWAKTIRDRS